MRLRVAGAAPMKRWARIAGILLSVAAGGYFLAFAYHTAARTDLRTLFKWPMLGAVALTALGSTVIIPASSWAWGRLLLSVGVRVPAMRLNSILGISQIAKYVPGNLAQVVGRSAMSIASGAPSAAIFVTIAAETILSFSAAITAGVLTLLLYARAMPDPPFEPADLAGITVFAMLVAVLTPVAAIRYLPGVLSRMTRLVGKWLGVITPSAAAMMAAFAVYLLNYVIMGLGLYATVVAAAGKQPGEWALAVGVFALSWLLGAIAPGVPAGLGVREGAMSALLSTAIGSPQALQAIVAFRIATTLGDILALAWGAGLGLVTRLEGRPPSRATRRSEQPGSE